MGFLDNLKDKVNDRIHEAAEEARRNQEARAAENKRNRKATFEGIYVYGHPHVKENNIPVWLILYENQLAVKQKHASGENLVFELPYEKIESTNIVDAERLDRSSPIASAIDVLNKQKVKGEILEIVALGKDKSDNIVRIPILFCDINRCVNLKTAIDNEIGKSREITI